ncbi:CDC48 family AAA ATPase [Candidatus Bathyarchaeota archaeon]|nr:CDC48 family AAA ATPase [Candidatus Bathyarchaeota archaeon]
MSESTQTSNSLTLRVSEASQRDFGRGIARIDPQAMKKMSVQTGDVIQIAGKKRTAAKVMPAYPENRGKDIIQIDGIIRNNSFVGIGDNVCIEKIDVEKAEKVTLAPLEQNQPWLKGEKPVEQARKLLEGLPLVEGDQVRLNLLGSNAAFIVARIKPNGGAVIVHATTEIAILEKTAQNNRKISATYEDVGGLAEQIQRTREMIELPLRHPEVFDRLGIEPPKGVLLHGPPGTGKTLIAKAVANETFATFISISGAEIHGKYYGESEGRLREIFNEAAQNKPCIIFIDEIDAIAPKREEVTGEVEKRVVSQLLALMDGLEPRGQVVVIGATNRPNAIDPALRRGGRFDREIEIGMPTREGRFEIFQIHTRGMPLTPDVDLGKLANLTHGFTGADITELCKEAAMKAMRRVLPDIDFEADYISPEVLNKLVVMMEDFLYALRFVDPSALREVLVETPNVTWNDIGGLEELKQELKEAIEWPLKYADIFEEAGAKPPKGILLCGPPGTGKTLLAKAVAKESEANFIQVKGPALMNKFVGESEKGVREIFRKAKQTAPCIIFFDEIDALVPKRGSGAADSHVSERVISQFLTEMDGLEELHGVMILAATNRIDIIDPAMLRPGRFDLLLQVPPPDKEARLEIFKIHTAKNHLAKDVSLEELVVETEGCTGADIEAICREATMRTIRRHLNNIIKQESRKPPKLEVTMDDLREAIGKMGERKKLVEKVTGEYGR